MPTNATMNTALALKANIASPTFTGAPLAPTAATTTNTTQIATTAFVQNVANTVPPVGTIAVWPTASAPTKWRALTSVGELLSRTTYSALFAIIGTTFMTTSDAGSLATQFRTPKSTDFPILNNTVSGGSTGSFVWMIYTGV
jgi:hypothetical protein